MEKYTVLRNNEPMGEFSTFHDRGDEKFLDEFYSMLMPLVPDAGFENLKNKAWSELDANLDFDIDGKHYSIKHIE